MQVATQEDSTTYQYTNANCPYNVTGTTDASGVQRWAVTYDNGSCMATASGAPTINGGAPVTAAYQVAYTPVGGGGTTFTRTVTNPLGKVSTYTYLNNATQGLQLTGVANAASTNSPASSKSYSYGLDGFVSLVIDENGNKETQTHVDCSYVVPLKFICGMPNLIVEASTSSTPRTTAMTWDTTWHEPDIVSVCSGLSCTSASTLSTTTFAYTGFGAVKTKTVVDETNFTLPYPTHGQTRVWTWSWPADQISWAAVHGPRWVSRKWDRNHELHLQRRQIRQQHHQPARPDHARQHRGLAWRAHEDYRSQRGGDHVQL